MNRESILPAVEILGAAEKGLNELKEFAGENVHIVEPSGRFVLYPTNSDAQLVFEDYGLDLGPENTRFAIIYIDTITDVIKPSHIVQQMPADSADIDEDGHFQLFDINAVIDFIMANPDALLEDLDAAFPDLDSDQDPIEEAVAAPTPTNAEEDTTSEAPVDDVAATEQPATDEQAPEQAAPAAEPIAESPVVPEPVAKQAPEDNDDESDSFQDDGNLDDWMKDTFGKTNTQEAAPHEEQDISDTLPSGDVDPLMTKAIALFDSSTVTDTLPIFPDAIAADMSPNFAAASSHLVKARSKGIMAIYHQLQANQEAELAHSKETAVADAENARDTNITKIKANRDTKIAQLEQIERSAYEDQKEHQAQVFLDTFKEKYDKDHLPDLTATIEMKSEQIRNEANAEISEEISSFDSYQQQVEQAVYAHVTESADIDGVVSEYKSVVTEESAALTEAAKKRQQEIDQLNASLNATRQSLEFQKQSEASRIALGIDQGISEQTQALRDKLDNENELRKQKEAELASERKKSTVIAEQYNSLHSQMAELQAQLNQLHAAPAQPAPVVATPEPKQASNGQLLGKIGSFVAAAVILIGIGFGGGRFISGSASAQPAQAVRTAASAPRTSTAARSTAASSSDDAQSTDDNSTSAPAETASKKESGDNSTFTYTTSDGKKVTVIKDGDNAGHYIDDKGNNHSVVFK